jgi:hypothetical protein
VLAVVTVLTLYFSEIGLLVTRALGRLVTRTSPSFDMPTMADQGKTPARPASRELVLGTLVVAALALGLAGTALAMVSSSFAADGAAPPSKLQFSLANYGAGDFAISIVGPESTPGPSPAISALKVIADPREVDPPAPMALPRTLR